MRRARAVVGPSLALVGVAHTGLTLVLYPGVVQRVVAAGVVNGVTSDPDDVAARSAAFWFATTGVGLVATGAVVTSLEHRVSPLPGSLPWVLLGVGAWGAVLLPASPFWVLGALAGLAEVRRRRASPRRGAGARAVQ